MMPRRASAGIRRLRAVGGLLLILCAMPAPLSAMDELELHLEERSRLEAIQLRLQAVRLLGEHDRRRTLETIERKVDDERERVREAYDELVRQMRATNRERQHQLIDELERHILRYPHTQAAGDLYLRLAELYFEDANFTYIQAMNAYDEAYEAWVRGEIEREPPMPAPDYSRARELYATFLERFPSHRYIREALYLFAYTLADAGDEAAAVEIYEQLIERDPSGPLTPEAAFRVGEYHFNQLDFELAAEAYRQTLRLRDANFFVRALYKLSWTYYLIGDLDRALIGFGEMIEVGDRGEAEGATMRNESLQYMAIIFSERGGLAALRKYFADLGGRSYEDEVVIRLGDIWFENGDFAQSREVYASLLQTQPLLEQAPEVGRKIETCWQRLGEENEVIEGYRDFALRFGPGSDWLNHWRERRPDLAREVIAEAEKKRYDYALWLHGQGQQAEQRAERDRWYAAAISAYEGFSAQFPESARRAESAFNRAEIAYEQERWAEAAALYVEATELDINPNSELFTEASWNQLLARRRGLDVYEQSRPGQRRLADEEAWRVEREGSPDEITGAVDAVDGAEAAATVTAAVDDAPAPVTLAAGGAADGRRGRAGIQVATEESGRTLPREAADLIRSSLYYVRLYPLGERSPNVFYNTGDIYFRYGFYARARQQYQQFVDRFPENEFVLDAIQQITRSFIIERQFGELVRWGYRIYESPLANRQEIYLYFTNILSGAMFKDGEQLMEANRLNDAAEVFLRMVEQFPQSQYVAEALINAAVSYQRRGDWERSSAVYRRIYGELPEHSFAPTALFQVAWNAERVLEYPEAVSRYLELLDVFPEAEQTKDALFNSATILAKLGASRRAAELYLDYIRRYPGEDDEADNLFFAAQAYLDDGELETARPLFQRYVAHPDRNERELEARYLLARIARDLGQDGRYLELLEEVIRTSETLVAADRPVDPKYATEAAYVLAERFDRSYRDIRLRLPLQVMARLLEQKAEQLGQVVERYTAVLNHRDPFWSSAALHQIGEAYQHFAETLFEAPVPPELDEMEAEIYMLELEDQAFPIEDRAMQAWRRNIDLAARLGVRNEWVDRSRTRLIRLYPDLAEVKAEEAWAVSQSAFYYRFGRSDQPRADLRIEGPRVVYVGEDYRLEGLEERYKLVQRWTDRQRRVVFDFELPDPVLIRDGRPLRIDGILELWSRQGRTQAGGS